MSELGPNDVHPPHHFSPDGDKELSTDLMKVVGSALGLVLLITVVIVFWKGMMHDKRMEEAQQLVDGEAKIIVTIHGKNYEPPEDPWGTPLVWTFEPNNKVNVAVTLSAGPDKEFLTDDDFHGKATDYNKTGIVAEWAGSKVKEGVKGFFKGLKRPSNHKDPKD